MQKEEKEIEEFKRAVAATLRALSGKKDIDISFAAAEIPDRPVKMPEGASRLPCPDFVDKDLVRGAADLRAIRLLHKNDEFHKQHASTNLQAREIYEALQNARIEAIEARKMKGVAKNLNIVLADKCERMSSNIPQSIEDVNIADSLYIYAKTVFTNEIVTDKALHIIRLWEKWFEENGQNNYVKILKSYIDDEKSYSKNILSLLNNLGFSAKEMDSDKLPNDKEESKNNQEDNSQNENKDKNSDEAETENGNIDEQGSEESLEEDSLITSKDENLENDEIYDDEDVINNESETSETNKKSNNHHDSDNGFYTIYTDAFDEIVKAEELADIEDLTRLRKMLDEQLSHLQSVIGKLANRLQRKLMARQQRGWQFDLEEGYIDNSRLARAVANPSVPLSFKQEQEDNFKDTIVSILIDNSGSMRGRPIAIAAMCTDILARTLERCGVNVEIVGFTTKSWKGGKSRELWISNGRPENPGRLNDIRHIIYKAADTPMRRARKNLGLMLKEGILKENIDGEALHWAYNRLASRPEKRKILIVISDGAPVDDSTLSVNSVNYLEEDLLNIICWIEEKTPIEVSAIGIGHDVTRYYKNSITIKDASELAEAMISRLEDLFNKH